VHLGIYFPGGTLGADPFWERLAWVTIRAMEDAGAVVVPVRYDDDVLEPDPDRFKAGITREVNGALAHYRPDQVTIVGKSRGTHALRAICEGTFALPDDTRLIWQTPTFGADKPWAAAKATALQSLYIIGLADGYHVPERHAELPGETVAIGGANHGLEIEGDIFATLDAWRTMCEAIVRFARRG
jgi:hypothetical protein